VTDESLFREVDEEVRQDEYKKIWDRFGNVFIGIAVACVAAVAGWKGYEHYQRSQSEAAAIVYQDAVKKFADGKYDDALGALKAVRHAGYAQLARLQEAAVLADKGDTEQAVAAYDAIAADGAVDPLLQDLARIRAGYLLVDTATPDQLLTRLGKFDKDSEVWRHQAREIFGLSAWRVQDYQMADRYMNAIYADAETPSAMRQRAQVMVQLIAPHLAGKRGQACNAAHFWV
jgi:hypothetical protein